MLFDSHTHINNESYTEEEREELIRGIEASELLSWCTDIGFDLPSSILAAQHAEKYPWCFAAVGVHPHDSGSMTEEILETLGRLAAQPGVRAIGEIGLDYHYDFSPRDVQKKVFRRQIALAREMQLPMVLHIREAHGDALAILREEKELPKGVVHCYSGSMESAQSYLDLGLDISFTGSVTFKNAHNLQAVAARLPIERIMIETDCPYMAPVPHRGKRNEPAHVLDVLRFLADLRGEDEETLARVTFENGLRLFQIS